MSTLLETKKRHEAACEAAIRGEDWREALRCAARAADAAFALAERTEGDVARSHVEDGEDWLRIAERLKKRPADGEKHGGKGGDSAARKQSNRDDESDDAGDWQAQGTPEVRFHDIVGMDELKQRIRRYILKAQNPEEVARWKGARSGDGMILFGPPGTGKTFFAKAVATELDAAFFDVKGSNLLSKWVGESQKNVSRLFDELATHERAVLFMDEIDGVLAARGSGSSSVREGVLTEFLSAMDGVRSNMRSLLFIGATNRAVSLDQAILSRVGSLVYVPLPDLAARRAMLEQCFAGLPDGTDESVGLDALARRFEHCSMRDIRRFADILIDLGICRKLEGGPGTVDAELIEQAWTDAAPAPLSEADRKKYERLAKE